MPSAPAAEEMKTITPADLITHFKQYALVDVRSHYAYHTLHIDGAYSLPRSSAHFVERLRRLTAHIRKPIVFICRRETCAPAFERAAQAVPGRVDTFHVYEAGMLSWAEAHPSETLLLGTPLKSTSQLISVAQFDAHLLSPRTFYEQVMGNPHVLVIDVRDPDPRGDMPLVQLRDVQVPLDNQRLKAWVHLAKKSDRTLYFIDTAGHEVPWLQYFLTAQGVQHYWFMKGGARAFDARM